MEDKKIMEDKEITLNKYGHLFMCCGTLTIPIGVIIYCLASGYYKEDPSMSVFSIIALFCGLIAIPDMIKDVCANKIIFHNDHIQVFCVSRNKKEPQCSFSINYSEIKFISVCTCHEDMFGNYSGSYRSGLKDYMVLEDPNGDVARIFLNYYSHKQAIEIINEIVSRANAIGNDISFDAETVLANRVNYLTCKEELKKRPRDNKITPYGAHIKTAEVEDGSSDNRENDNDK